MDRACLDAGEAHYAFPALGDQYIERFYGILRAGFNTPVAPGTERSVRLRGERSVFARPLQAIEPFGFDVGPFPGDTIYLCILHSRYTEQFFMDQRTEHPGFFEVRSIGAPAC